MNKNGSESPNEVEVTFVINGEDVTVKANPHQPIEAARNKALAESENTGRSPNEWEIRTSGGVLIPPGTKVEDLGLAAGTKLMMSLAVGSGG